MRPHAMRPGATVRNALKSGGGRGRDKKKARLGVVDENTLGYYRRVATALDEGFEGNEEKGLFIRNVFGQLLKEVGRVCRNQTISKIVERLLAHADAVQCSALVEAFLDASPANDVGGGGDDSDEPSKPAADGWLALCKDRFASHVVQACVARMSEYVAADDAAAVACLARLCVAVGSACAELAADTYASHVVRVTAEVAGGVEVAETVVRSRLSRENPRKVLFPFFEHSAYKSFKKLFKSLGAKLFPDDRNAIFALAKDVSANPVMQTVLAIVQRKDPRLCSDLCRRLLVTGRIMDRGDGLLPSVLTNEIASYLFEAVLAAADDELHAELFESHVRPSVAQLAAHPVANFVLQRVLTSVRSELQFKILAKKLCPCLEETLACGHVGVIVRLFEASHKYPKRQPKLVKGLLEAFHCYSPEARRVKAAHLVLQLSTYEAFFSSGDGGSVHGADPESAAAVEDEEGAASAAGAPDSGSGDAAGGGGVLRTIAYQGSLLMQQLLRLEAPGAAACFVDGVLSLRPSELRVVCCSPCGSHALDAFLDSPAIQPASKAALWKRLQPLCADLCCDKHGSRVMDRLWSGASRRVREELAGAAGAAVRRLMGSPYGRILCSNFAINDFLHRRRDWDAAQAAIKRKQQQPPGGSGDVSAYEGRPAKKAKQTAAESRS